MIFVVAAIFILVISFVVALVSLVREQSKIEKENVGTGKNQSQPEIETPQTASDQAPPPDLTNIGTVQPQPPSQPQPQPAAPGPDYNVVPLKEKPWWEEEIQKRDEEPQGSTLDWQNTGQVQKPQTADHVKTEESGEVSEPENHFGGQVQKEKDRNLQGSFSLSDLAKGDQES